MAGNQPPHEGLGDDFFEQILAVQPGYGGGAAGTGGGGGGGGGEMVGSTLPMIMALQLGSSGAHVTGLRNSNHNNSNMGMLPLGLNLEDHSFLRHQEVGGGDGNNNNNNNNVNNVSSSTTASGINQRDSLHMTSLFPALGHLQIQAIRPAAPPPPGPPQLHQPFQAQPAPGAVSAVSHPPTIRPRVRARRGQATDPHSIAERLRRERIAERMKALQELVPTANKTDRAAMLDEIVDYVKFLRLQVKVLSMSRLGAAGAVAQLVADIPMSSVEGEGIEEGSNQQLWEKWSNDGTEQQVAKLMEEDIGAAMQFLQSKALCIMPISLASAIFRTHQSDHTQALVKPESNAPS